MNPPLPSLRGCLFPVVVSVFIGAAPGLLRAQNPPHPERQATGRVIVPDLPLEGAYRLSQLSELMDKTVKNRRGEEIGHLREMVIDRQGRIKYAVLGHGGMLGVGERWTAIDWTLLELAPEGDHFLLEVNQAQLEQAPTFEEDRWPAEPQVRRPSDWPAAEEQPERRGRATEARTVTVREGETLSALAERVYGRAELWEQIYEANRDKITDPDHIPAGTRLSLPPAPGN